MRLPELLCCELFLLRCPNLLKIGVLGVLGMAIYQSLAYFAAPKTSATNMGIILSLMPMMSLSMAIIALGQRLTMGAIVGAICSFLGVLLVVSHGDLASIMRQGDAVVLKVPDNFGG